jgi:phosphatidylserine/phosphatidylglycerophosphate/cardiolipin synthase-like enzyme
LPLDEQLVNRVLTELAQRKGLVRGTEITSRIAGMKDDDLFSLIVAGVLKPSVPAIETRDYEFRIDHTRLPFRPVNQSQVGILEDDVAVVATLPLKNLAPIRNLKSLHAELCKLIINATSDVSIINPYFDAEGRRRILPYLKAAVERGVGIRVISRGARSLSGRNQAASFLRPLLKERTYDVELRSFQVARRAPVHAKMLISDSTSVYVGSANLTGRSLASNLEVGVVLRGPSVSIFRKLFDHLWVLSDKS